MRSTVFFVMVVPWVYSLLQLRMGLEGLRVCRRVALGYVGSIHVLTHRSMGSGCCWPRDVICRFAPVRFVL